MNIRIRWVSCFLVAISACFILTISAKKAYGIGKICFLKAGQAYFSGTPCTDAANAYDGQKTLLNFDSCTAPFDVAVVFEQEPGDAQYLVAFQVSVEYYPYQLSVNSCTLDPYDLFSDKLTADECNSSYDGSRYYSYGAEGNLFDDYWPSSNPNFVLMEVEYANVGIGEDGYGELVFFGEISSRYSKVGNINHSLSSTLISADIICGGPPPQPNPPTNVNAQLDGYDAISVSWSKPAQFEDGSPLTDPMTFHVYRGSGCQSTDTIKVESQGSVDPFSTGFHDTGLEMETTYYYYLTVEKNGVESEPSGCAAATTGEATITGGVTGALTQFDRSELPAPGEKFPEVGISGVTIELLDVDTVVGTATTDENGDFTIHLYSDTTGKTYTLRAVVTRDSGLLADPGTLIGAQGIRTLVKDITIDGSITEIAIPQLGAGPAVGDADCNGYVDVQDFLIFKDCFGANSGEETYTLDCDFNGTGAVDVEDFLILKKNFALAGGEPEAGLCQSE